jgi:transcriptional regulator with XRE-family HTH domain
MENEKLEKVIKNIATARTKKGYTYENMAHELSLTPAAYRKIETGETKLTLERLFHISEILNAPLPDLLEIGNMFQQTNHENSVGYQQKILNLYQDSKEIYEKLLQSKEEQIVLLKSLLGKK